MIVRFLLVVAFATIGLSATRPVVIRDVSVVDPSSGIIETHRDIVVRGDRFASIRGAAKPTRAPVRYAIPGLWDMHVHLWFPDNQFPKYLAAGVTGLRDMGSDFSRVKSWRAQIKAGTLTGPRIVTCGPPLSGPVSEPDPKLPTIVVRDANDARKAFDTLDDKLGVDFIKVLSNVPANAFYAVSEYSRHWGHRIVGHLPDEVPARLAADARMGSMEHLFGLALACSSREAELREERRVALEKKDKDALAKIDDEIRDSYDAKKAAQLFEKFKIYDVMQTPTLTMLKRMTGKDDAAYMRMEHLVRDLNRAGVPILAGTDTGDPGTVPGAELHKELELLAAAGLTPLEALRAATTTPARLMRKDDTLGVIKPGAYADVVLLDANPLTDIRNILKISAVMVNGKYINAKPVKPVPTRKKRRRRR